MINAVLRRKLENNESNSLGIGFKVIKTIETVQYEIMDHYISRRIGEGRKSIKNKKWTKVQLNFLLYSLVVDF